MAVQRIFAVCKSIAGRFANMRYCYWFFSVISQNITKLLQYKHSAIQYSLMCQYLLLQGIHLDKIPVPCFFSLQTDIFLAELCIHMKKLQILKKCHNLYTTKFVYFFFTELAQRSLRLFKNTIKPSLGTQVIVIIYCQTCVSLRMSVGPAEAIGTVKISFNKRSTFLMKMCEV